MALRVVGKSKTSGCSSEMLRVSSRITMLNSQLATPVYRLGQQHPFPWHEGVRGGTGVRMLWSISIDCFGLWAIANFHGALYDATCEGSQVGGDQCWTD